MSRFRAKRNKPKEIIKKAPEEIDTQLPVFGKFPRTIDETSEYRATSLSRIIFNLLLNDEIVDFTATSKIKKYGGYDDVIIRVEMPQNNYQNYAFVLDYGYRSITTKNLVKGFESLEIKMFIKEAMQVKAKQKTKQLELDFKIILYTNRPFDFIDEVHKMKVDEFDVEVVDGELEELITKDGKCYQFKIIGDYAGEKFEDYKNLFKNLYFYTKQPRVTAMKEEIVKVFIEKFGSYKLISDYYIQFMHLWRKGYGKKVPLNKTVVKEILTMVIFFPFIRPYITTQSNTKSELFKRATKKFDVTFFDQDSCTYVQKLWGDLRDDLNDWETVVDTAQKYQIVLRPIKNVSDLTDEEVNLIAWLSGKVPLILVDDESLYKGMEMINIRNYFMVGEKILEEKFPVQTIFQNFSQLESDAAMYKEMMETYECSLQGKQKMTMQTLIERDEEIRAFVTTSELVRMLYDPLVIGEPAETLPFALIPRKVTRSIVNPEFLDTLDEDTLIVISCDTSQKFLQSSVVSIPKECTQQEFETICEQHPQRTKYYHFRVVDDGKLEWLVSKGDIREVEKYLCLGNTMVRTHLDEYVEEATISEYEALNNINLVCGKPGMGKTILMRNLKNKHPSTFWTLMVIPKDHTWYFAEKDYSYDEFIEYLVEEMGSKYRKFDQQVMQVFKNKNKLQYIWDGMDEADKNNLKIIVHFIDELRKRNFKQWVVSRSCMTKFLEDHFMVLSKFLKPFDDKDQHNYIKRRLGLSDEETREVIDRIKDLVRIVDFNDFLETPSNIFLIAEFINGDHIKFDYLLDGVLAITEMYDYFLDETFEIMFREKAYFDRHKTVIAGQILDRFKFTRLNFYSQTAVKAIFDKGVMEELRLDCDEFLDDIKEEDYSFNIITKIDDQKMPTYFHPSFGPFFAALFFWKHHAKIPNFIQMVFREEYKNVRFYFDLFMTKDCPAHVAFLYEKYELLKNYKVEEFEDLGGRNVLQLACSWGNTYFALKTKEIDGKYEIDDEETSSLKEENPEYQKTLEYLFEICDSKQVDTICEFDSVGYAIKARSLSALAVLSRTHKVNFNKKYFEDACTILYYCVKFDLSNIFEMFEEIPFIKNKKGQSLLNMAKIFNATNCLKKIQSNPIYALK